jgi:hypothetical protein
VKGILALFLASILASSLHAQTVVMTIDLSSKEVTVADTISIRETVPVMIVNLGSSVPDNLTMRFLDNDAVVYAQQVGFASYGTDSAYGTIDLNTQELVDYFEGSAMQTQRAFTMGLWDTTLNRLLVNSVVTIQNNPYSPGMPGPSPIGVTYMEIDDYDADGNGIVDTSDALIALTNNPPWMAVGTNDAVQSGVATNAGSNTWVAFAMEYTGVVSVVAAPSDDFEYEATIRVQEPVATTGFYFTVSSAAGTVTNAWKVFWVASPESATGIGGGGTSYTDADAVAAVSNVLGTAAWVDVGTATNEIPTYADVLAVAGGTNSITNATVTSTYTGSSYTSSVTRTGRVLEFDILTLPLAQAGLGYEVGFPSGPFLPGELRIGITNSGVTSAMILDEAITLADISDAAETTLVARAGNVWVSSNQTYAAGTTQAFDIATANTAGVSRLDVDAPDLVIDNEMDDGAEWTLGTNWFIADSFAYYSQSSGTASSTLSKDIGAIAGRTYLVRYGYGFYDGVGVSFRAKVGGAGGIERLTGGVYYEEEIVAGTNGLLEFTISPLLGGVVVAGVDEVYVYDLNSDITISNGVVNVGGRTVTWDKIALWDAAGAGTGTATNSTHLGGVAAASYALDADVTTEIAAHNTNASAHSALFVLKQDAATAATDAELAAHVTNATPHAAQFAAYQPLDADLTTLAGNNGGSLTNLQPFRTAWKIAYGNASSQWTEIPLGVAGSVLRSTGPSSAPAFGAISVTATNVALADLTDVVATNAFAVGDGANLVVTSLEDTKALLGVGQATNVLFDAMGMAGSTNDVVVSLGGTSWTNQNIVAVLTNEIAILGGGAGSGIDADKIDGFSSEDFLVAASGIDDISDVDVATAASGEFLMFDGTNWINSASIVDTNALEALWDADITTATGTLYSTLSGEITSATGTLYSTLSGEITSATGTLYSTVSGEIATATGEVYAAAVAAYADGDTAVSNALINAFYVGYTNLLEGYEAGDTAVSNHVAATFVRKDGSVAMTGNLNMGGHSITNIAASSLKFVGGAEISAAKVAAWDAGSLTGSTVNVTNDLFVAGDLTVGGNLVVTGTLTCAGINLNGTTITNWNESPVTPATPGELTVTVKYSPSGAWIGGTLHLYAWNNANFTGPTIFNQSYVYTDIRGTHTITVTNKETLVGNTYWYAWLDGDGDGTFNMSFEDGGTLKTFYQYPFNEPAAVAEHMPVVLSGSASDGDIDIWLLDNKGNTPRFGSYVDDPTKNEKRTIQNLTYSGETTWSAYSAANNFVTERSYLRTDSDVVSSFAGRYSVGGFGTSRAVGSLRILNNNTIIGNPFLWGNNSTTTLNPINANNANAPTAYHPTSGETITTNVIEFAFTDQWVTYSAMQLEVLEDSTSGTSRYSYSGYMENEHYDDGTTSHKATISGMTAGKTYYWRVRCTYGYVADANFKPTAYSAWESFVYNP